MMTGHNVGDLLNARGISWGWFYGDFAAQSGSTPNHALCGTEYDVHYDPFQYYPSTANPQDPDHSFIGGRVEYDGGQCDGW